MFPIMQLFLYQNLRQVNAHNCRRGIPEQLRNAHRTTFDGIIIHYSFSYSIIQDSQLLNLFELKWKQKKMKLLCMYVDCSQMLENH